jgi:hypothetical protein
MYIIAQSNTTFYEVITMTAKKEKNGTESLRRLKHILGCNSSKRRRRRITIKI